LEGSLRPDVGFFQESFNFMKKYIVVSVLVFMPFLAHAEVPTLFGFLDGSVYGIDGQQKYLCFLNGECIDKNDKVYTRDQLFAGSPVAKVAGTSTPPSVVVTPPVKTYTLNTIPNQWFPRSTDDMPIADDSHTVRCNTSTSSDSMITIQCTNGSRAEIEVKQILFEFIGTKHEQDYDSVSQSLHLFTSSGTQIDFRSHVGNTFFNPNGRTANVIYTLPNIVSIPVAVFNRDPQPVALLQSYGMTPTRALVSVKGRDIVYKINP
jgi:hypothetical protein